MKPWQINISSIIGVVALYILLPKDVNRNIIYIIFLTSAIWVYFDAKKLEIGKYKKTFISLSTTPGGVAVIVLLLWPLAFPMYISFRQRIKDGKIPLK